MLREWIAVGIGGMLGATLRHLIAALLHQIGNPWPPLATLLANAVGCFAIGALFAWSELHQSQSHWTTVGLRVGLLGGLTTFSSFALEAVLLWRERPIWGLGLVAIHLAVGIVALIAGWGVTERINSVKVGMSVPPIDLQEEFE